MLKVVMSDDPVPNSSTDVGAVRDLVVNAIRTLISGDLRRFDRVVDQLGVLGATASGLGDVASVVVEECSLRLRSCWKSGWQPIDVVEVVGKLDSASHRALVGAAVVFDARHDAGKAMHPLWAEQLHDLAALHAGCDGDAVDWLTAVRTLGAFRQFDMRDVVEVAIGVLVRLGRLRPLPRLLAAPGPEAAIAAAAATAESPHVDRDRSASVDGELAAKMLSRVRGLLAKAESTDFPDEADALTEKAQELITRYSIDEAMLQAQQTSVGGRSVDGPNGVRIHLDPPYIDAKATLVSAVAAANRCRAVQDAEYGFVTVFGFRADLHVVDMLFTSLLAQASSAMVAAGRVLDRNGTSKTRSFRQAFLVSYAHRIGERLSTAAKSSTAAAESTLGDSVLPVLARRDVQVEDAVTEAYPKVVRKRTRVSSAAGWEAGREAANKASLHRSAQLRPTNER